jgi:uncharacterized membrane protein
MSEKFTHHTSQSQSSLFFDIGRLTFLIDGVFAVSITLLVLDLKLPEGNGDLVSSLRQMLPAFLVYLIDFASIAGYWTIHNGNFHYISHGDGRLVVLSLFNLLFITLFPLAASIVGAHPLEPLATVCLSANGFLYCISLCSIWSYAIANHRLIRNEDGYRRLHSASLIMLFVAIGLAIAIPLAFVNVYLVYAIWILWASIGSTIVMWWIRRRSGQESS